jgi:hypothetical protein
MFYIVLWVISGVGATEDALSLYRYTLLIAYFQNSIDGFYYRAVFHKTNN